MFILFKKVSNLNIKITNEKMIFNTKNEYKMNRNIINKKKISYNMKLGKHFLSINFLKALMTFHTIF